MWLEFVFSLLFSSNELSQLGQDFLLVKHSFVQQSLEAGLFEVSIVRSKDDMLEKVIVTNQQISGCCVLFELHNLVHVSPVLIVKLILVRHKEIPTLVKHESINHTKLFKPGLLGELEDLVREEGMQIIVKSFIQVVSGCVSNVGVVTMQVSLQEVPDIIIRPQLFL